MFSRRRENHTQDVFGRFSSRSESVMIDKTRD